MQIDLSSVLQILGIFAIIGGGYYGMKYTLGFLVQQLAEFKDDVRRDLDRATLKMDKLDSSIHDGISSEVQKLKTEMVAVFGELRGLPERVARIKTVVTSLLQRDK